MLAKSFGLNSSDQQAISDKESKPDIEKEDKKKSKAKNKKKRENDKSDNYDDDDDSYAGYLLDLYGIEDEEDDPKKDIKLSKSKSTKKRRDKDSTGSSEYPLGDYLNALSQGDLDMADIAYDYIDIPPEERAEAVKNRTKYMREHSDVPKISIEAPKYEYSVDKLNRERAENYLRDAVIDGDLTLEEAEDIKKTYNYKTGKFDYNDSNVSTSNENNEIDIFVNEKDGILKDEFIEMVLDKERTEGQNRIIEDDMPGYEKNMFEYMCEFMPETIASKYPTLVDPLFEAYNNSENPLEIKNTIFFNLPIAESMTFNDSTWNYFYNGGSKRIAELNNVEDEDNVNFQKEILFLNDSTVTLDLRYAVINYNRYGYDYHQDIPSLSLQELMMGEVLCGLYNIKDPQKPEEEFTRRDYFDKFKKELTDEEKASVITMARNMRVKRGGGNFILGTRNSKENQVTRLWIINDRDEVRKDLSKNIGVYMAYYQYGANINIMPTFEDLPDLILEDKIGFKPNESNFFKVFQPKMKADDETIKKMEDEVIDV